MPSSVLGKLTEVCLSFLPGLCQVLTKCTGLLAAEGQPLIRDWPQEKHSKNLALHFLDLICMSPGAKLHKKGIRRRPKQEKSVHPNSVLLEKIN